MIRTALSSRRPDILEAFIARIRARYEYVARIEGSDKIPGNYKVRWHEAEDVLSLCDLVDAEGKQTTNPNRGVHVINEARLTKAAAQTADAVVESWIARVEQKTEALQDVEIVYAGGYEFLITGTRNGRAVQVRQDMIINFSHLGKMFNQYPARLKLDGKAISEAAYKKAFA